jgi:hypothetical protein
MYLFYALLLSGAAKQTAASAIAFDNVDGHYLAQVKASIQRNATTTTYQGYSANYGPIPISDTNFGPAVPGGFFPTTAAFSDPLTGNLGVAGSSPLGLANDYASIAEADFAIAVEFNQAGTVSFSMHEKGFVGAASVNPPNDFAFARMQTSVAIIDNSTVNNTGRASSGTLLCISRFNSVFGILCSTPTSVDQDFVATLDVLPGHVYTLSAAEWGDESSYGIFDGIDPVTMSLQLDPGMFIVPVDGTTLPGFLGGPAPGGASVPEPATWKLAGCVAAILAGRRLQLRRRLGASPEAKR